MNATPFGWMDEHRCELVKTLPCRAGMREPEMHVVRYLGVLKDCQVDPISVLSERERVKVDNHPAYWSYDAMPRFWRERLFPGNFERWTRAEHASKPTSLTWDQQEQVWAHIDTWEAYHDGQLTLDQARQHIAYLGPLPKVMTAKQLARKLRAKPPKIAPAKPWQPTDVERQVAPKLADFEAKYAEQLGLAVPA